MTDKINIFNRIQYVKQYGDLHCDGSLEQKRKEMGYLSLDLLVNWRNFGQKRDR